MGSGRWVIEQDVEDSGLLVGVYAGSSGVFEEKVVELGADHIPGVVGGADGQEVGVWRDGIDKYIGDDDGPERNSQPSWRYWLNLIADPG